MKTNDNSRREFLATSLLTGAALVGCGTKSPFIPDEVADVKPSGEMVKLLSVDGEITLVTPEQFKKAQIKGETPKDVVTKNAQKIKPSVPQGISLKELSPEQKRMLGQIIVEYVGRARPDFAIQEMKEITAAPEDQIYFGWSGGLEVGQGHYYCVQGPTFLLELDNTQNNANHVHTVWRDLKKDFGYDVLAEHLNTAHGK
ncbi:MAG: DUF3500 domain-containing protein [Chitinophagia bacterium]|nr:DUF3500 domain-containing protein [Chitinophagia bacterium]